MFCGEIAQAIVTQVRSHANPGYLSLQDLQLYQARQREPVCGLAWQICGVPPPSSGGVTVLQTLGILKPLNGPCLRMTWLGYGRSPLHPRPALKRANGRAPGRRDRAPGVCRPRPVPGRQRLCARAGQALTHPAYLASRDRGTQHEAHSMRRARRPAPGVDLALAPDRSPLRISTSHLSAVDDSGHALAMTTSVEAAFGAHVMVRGFLLNNTLTDFSFIAQEAAVANRVQPGKRPLSAMAPTLVFSRAGGELVASLGSPGAHRSSVT